MAIDPVLDSRLEVPTSEERWRRWDQRGRDGDAALVRRMRWIVWLGVALATAALVFWLVS